MITKELSYQDGNINCVGLVAYDDNNQTPRPAVMVVHDWSGRNQHAEEKAIALAEKGYVGFVVDMYGDKKNGQTNDEKAALATPFFEHRENVMRRMTVAFETLSDLPQVNPQKIAAIGYCFGGMCVLDLARSGAPIRGVVSFHGLLDAPPVKLAKRIQASVLVLHGYDDPMVLPPKLDRFAEEMSEANVDWQLVSYGHTLHAFTNKLANDKAFGTVYDKKADRRSWQHMMTFLEECFQ